MNGRLVLIRHGETDWNDAGRLQGSSDVPLNAVGRQQAREAGLDLRGEEWNVLVSSPLSRAVETARLIGEQVGLSLVQTIPGLVERDYREAEGTYLNGLTEPELTRELGVAEPEEDVAARGVAAVRQLLHEYPEHHIIAVAHGTIIRLTMTALTGRPHRRVVNGEAVEVDHALVQSYVAPR